MLPYLMAGSLIAGFVTAWLQSHPQSTKLPVSDRILKMRKKKKVILLTLVVDRLVKLAYLRLISSLTG